MPDAQTNQASDPANPAVTHHKTETINTDYEKIVAALPPVVEHLVPLVTAYRSVEPKNTELVEAGTTRRAMFNTVGLCFVVFCVSALAFFALQYEQSATAEKIVIGLLAFLGGFGARR